MNTLTRRAVLLTLIFATWGCQRLYPYYGDASLMQTPEAGAEQVDHRLLLIGDAGDADPGGEPALGLLARQAQLLPDRTTVAFLGDNVYERGMPPEESEGADVAAEAANALLAKVFDSRREAERCLNAEIDVVRGTAASAIFVPGNHDWDPFSPSGWDRVIEQQHFIQTQALEGEGANITMLPSGGCPGPVSVPLGKRGMLIVLDTEWWLEYGVGKELPDKPCPEQNPTGCPCTTEEQVTQALVEQLVQASKQNRWAIVVGHHPLNSAGPHGGFVEPWTHLFPLRFMRHYVPWYLEWLPLPGLGTAAVVARQHFSPSPQDASNQMNIHMRDALRDAMQTAEKQGAPTLAYAAGHDHSLQVFRTAKGPRYSIVSGLGATSRASEVGITHNTLFAHSNAHNPGFMQVDFLRNGDVRLSVIESEIGTEKLGTNTPGHEVFSMLLADAKTSRGIRQEDTTEQIWRRVRKRTSYIRRKIDPF